MSRGRLALAVCATALCTGTALAALTPQQKCDKARVKAWGKYVSCVENAVAVVIDPGGGGLSNYHETAILKCGSTYASRWARFQTTSTLASSSCVGSRFVDNGDGTVTDNLSGLVWEKKTNLDGIGNLPDPHDADNEYLWSTGSPWVEDGSVFTSFLATINGGGGFAGSHGWRLPTMPELFSIVPNPCPASFPSPCIDSTFGPTESSSQSGLYWTATTYVPSPDFAWLVSFEGSGVVRPEFGKAGVASLYARAVRGGL